MPLFGSIAANEEFSITGYDGNPATIAQDPTHRFTTDAEKTSWNAKVEPNDARLTDARTPLSHTHAASDITESTTRRFITDTERTTWNGKQDALGFTPVPSTRTVNGQALSSNVTLTKSDIGLANVPNVDATNPANIVQSATHRFVTDSEKTTWNGAVPAQYARVTGSNATTTGQALTNITGLSVALLTNSVYEFEAILQVQSSSTAGNGYGVNFSAAGATIEAGIHGTLTATATKSLRINALNTAASPYVTIAGTGSILIKGIITTGANSGNLLIQHLKVTSGTSTVFINSFLKAVKI